MSAIKQKLPIRRAYTVCIMSREALLDEQCTPLSNLYGSDLLFRRQHSNSETVALIGISVRYINDLLSDHSQIVQYLRECPELKYIDDIERLDPWKVRKNLPFFRSFLTPLRSPLNLERDCFVFNIEPRGRTPEELDEFPTPFLLPPGGVMEEVDKRDGIACALREFQEETEIKVHSHRILDEHTICYPKANPERRLLFYLIMINYS